jgi:hypothetical protein
MEIKFSFKFNNSIFYWIKKFKGLKRDDDDFSIRVEEYLSSKIEKSEFLQNMNLKISEIKISILI